MYDPYNFVGDFTTNVFLLAIQGSPYSLFLDIYLVITEVLYFEFKSRKCWQKMTLVYAAQTKRSVWLMTDRRLSYGDSKRAPHDDGVKQCHIYTEDGIVMLGYAGLGKTSVGIQPSTWMAGIFNGLKGTVPEHLELLKLRMLEQLPKHFKKIKSKEDVLLQPVIAPAIVNGKTRIFVVQFSAYRAHKRNLGIVAIPQYTNKLTGFKYNCCDLATGSGQREPFKIGNSWRRELFNRLKLFDNAKVDGNYVAEHLNILNQYSASIHDDISEACDICFKSTNKTSGTYRFPLPNQQFDNCGQAMIPTVMASKNLGPIVNAFKPLLIAQAKTFINNDDTHLEIALEHLKLDLEKISENPEEKLK